MSITTLGLIHIVTLACVQGLTEFLPISSSGHLVLVPVLLGTGDQGLVMDIAVHVGTLLAVIAYFHRDVASMAGDTLRVVQGKRDRGGARLALLVVLATLPVLAAGYWLHEQLPDGIRSIEAIAWATLGFGLLLWLADRFFLSVRDLRDLRWGDAMLIGLAQIAALIPGASRSGVTMTAGRLLGFERQDAARFSMLLSIPTILGAGTLATRDLVEAGDVVLTGAALLAAGLSFLAALVAIALLMRWLRRADFTPFVIYRILLGGGLLVWLHGFGGPAAG